MEDQHRTIAEIVRRTEALQRARKKGKNSQCAVLRLAAGILEVELREKEGADA